MIVGQKLLDEKLVKGGRDANLKHSTYDLTVGDIIPIGKKAIRKRQKDPGATSPYYLEPREMVWVLSKEEFEMPATVTGLATLRTSYTKDGILALNVGIIDPLYRGPVSTALINFSDRPRRIAVGDRFFRVAFFKHDDVTAYHKHDESIDRPTYLKNLEQTSYSDFSPSFLNIPAFDDEYYTKKFWSVMFYGFIRNKSVWIPVTLLLGITFWYLFHLGLGDFLGEKTIWIGQKIQEYKWW
jgi:deoxycytidine triphosphate deaminase